MIPDDHKQNDFRTYTFCSARWFFCRSCLWTFEKGLQRDFDEFPKDFDSFDGEQNRADERDDCGNVVAFEGKKIILNWFHFDSFIFFTFIHSFFPH